MNRKKKNVSLGKGPIYIRPIYIKLSYIYIYKYMYNINIYI